MENIRTIDDVQKKIKRYLDEDRARLELWRGVKRERKKDGTDFAALAKSFPAARFVQEFSWGNKRLKVYGRAASGQWIEDTIYLDVDGTTADRIEELIAARVAYLENICAGYEKGLSASVKRAKQIEKYAAKISDILKEATLDNTQYILEEYAKHNLRTR